MEVNRSSGSDTGIGTRSGRITSRGWNSPVGCDSSARTSEARECRSWKWMVSVRAPDGLITTANG